MAVVLDPPIPEAPSESSILATSSRPLIRSGALVVPALASVGAGTVHAAAAGAHSDYEQAVVAFAVVASLQLGIGAVALTSMRRSVAAVLALVNAAALLGWVVAKRSGVSFIDGLERAEGFRAADLAAAGFAACATVLAVVALARRMPLPRRLAPSRAAAVLMAVLTVSGIVWTGSATHGEAEEPAESEFAPVPGEEAVVRMRPYIPGQPIDLSGYEGVTPAQQAEAETILAATLYYLPQFADPDVATARGWRSIGDGVTGDEHFVNTATFDDGKILDPTAPESLVYEMIEGKKTLVAAMFMLWPGATFEDIPATGGDLMQWHIHDNLCFNADGRVAGLRSPGGACPAGLAVGGETPMIHVWIQPHPCGPFAALEGIAGGTVANGEARLCDAGHGASS